MMPGNWQLTSMLKKREGKQEAGTACRGVVFAFLHIYSALMQKGGQLC